MSAKSAFLSEKTSNAEGKRWIGLLAPARVDEWTGYRYYEEEQAMLFVRIKNLQQADFSIEEIKSLLGRNDDYVLAAFERKVEEQEQKLAKIRKIQKSYLEETMEMRNKGARDGIDEGMIMI